MPRKDDLTRLAVILCCVLNALLGLFGIALILLPIPLIRPVWVFLGSVAFLFGIARIIGYFSNDLYRLAFEHDIILGTVQALIGLALLLRGQWGAEHLCPVLSFIILTDAMFKCRMALEARKFGIERWSMILIAAVLTCVFGLIGVFLPVHLPVTFRVLSGLNLIVYALLNLVTVLTAVKTTKSKHSIIIEEAKA